MNSINSEDRPLNAATVSCPSREVLVRFLGGESAERECAMVTRHLDVCESCRSIIENLTGADAWKTELKAFGRSVKTNSGTDADTHKKAPAVGPLNRAVSLPIFPADRFHDLEPIGRGGCANVYRAEDAALGRIVALKFPHASLLVEPGAQKRFQVELRATAALHHPHIVALFDAGFDEHQSYIVFEYVAGPTLARWLDDREQQVDCRTAADIVLRLSAGVQHAHEAGILHRDLKPSNVLLDDSRTSGELPFTPKIADFGIARFLDSDVTHTIHETILGSPPFMSPEQALGDRSRIGPPSDVYALGGILYQLLTGRLPIQGASTADTLRRVLTDEPLPPRRFRADVLRDLEAICLKCLAKEPRKRYQSAAELERDLERFLAEEPVSVRPPSLWEQAVRVGRKHPAWTLLTATITAAIMLVMVMQSRHSSAVEELADELSDKNTALTATNNELERALEDAKVARDEARESVYAYDIRSAFAAAERGDARMVRSLLDRYADGTELAEYRSIGWNYLNLRAHRPHRELFRSPKAVYMARLSPDGQTLAVVGAAGFVHLVEFESGRLLAEWPAEQGEVNGCCFGPNGQRLWTAGDDGTVVLWDCSTQKRVYSIDAHKPQWAFEVVHDAQRNQIVTCAQEGTIRVWDAETGASRGELKGHEATVDTIQLHPDGRRLISQSSDATLRVWDLETLTEDHAYTSASKQTASFARVSPDGRWLVGCTIDSELVVFDMKSREELIGGQMINLPKRLCFDLSSRRVYIGDKLGAIEEWEFRGGTSTDDRWSRTSNVWQAHGSQISSLEWSPASGELITAARDGQVLAWPIAGPESSPLEYDFAHDSIKDFVGIPGEDRILVATGSGLWLDQIVDRRKGEAISLPFQSGQHWDKTAVSSDGRYWAATTVSGKLFVWRPNDERTIVEVEVYRNEYVDWLTFTPDSRYICTMNAGHDAFWIEVATGRKERLPLAEQSANLVFSPDGMLYASADDRSLGVFETASRKRLHKLAWTSIFGRTVCFFPDSQSLAVAEERKVRIFNVATGRMLREILGWDGRLTNIDVSADSRTLITWSQDGTMQLWHAPTGQRLASFPSREFRWAPTHFVNDETWLGYLFDGKTIRLLRLK